MTISDEMMGLQLGRLLRGSGWFVAGSLGMSMWLLPSSVDADATVVDGAIGDRRVGFNGGVTLRSVSIAPQLDTEIQIGPTGKTLLPLTVVR